MIRFIVLAVLLGWGFGSTLKVMTYNVENLFDTTKDSGKLDWQYLPMTTKTKLNGQWMEYCNSMRPGFSRRMCENLDWNQEKLEKKFHNIRRVLTLDGKEIGPDIVVLTEVENKKVLTSLNEIGLKKMGYKETILIEGEDIRGIDIAILSKYPLVDKPILHPTIPGFRGMLQASFDVHGETITIFGVHWPSLRNDESMRFDVAKKVKKIIKKLPKKRKYIIAGDFNTADPLNDKSALFSILYKSKLVIDSMDTANFVYQPIPGTHWYRGNWNFLDHILVSSNLSADVKSAKIAMAPFMSKTIVDRDTKKEVKIPNRWNPFNAKGFSDHYPVEIVLNWP